MQKPWVVLILALTVLYLIPIWSFHYFPSQDGPSHIANAEVIKDFGDQERVFDQYYRLNTRPFPNWISHLWLAGWLYLVPPLVAEKLLLSLYVILMPLCIWYLLQAAGHRQPLYLLLAYPFIYHFSLFMGFYNFSLAVPLCILSLGYWWKHREAWTWQRVAILNLCLATTYFSHLVPYLLFYALVPFLAIASLRTRWRLLLLNLVSVLPASILGIQYVLTSGFSAAAQTPNNLGNFSRLLGELLWLNGLVSFNLVHEKRLGRVLVVVIAVAIVLGIAHRMWRWHRERTALLESRDYFLLPCVIVLGFYFYLPDGVANQGGLVTARMNLLAGLFILPWLKEDIWKMARWGMTVLAVGVVLLNWGYFTHRIHLFQPELRAYTAGTDLLGENDVVMPLIFDKTGPYSGRVQVFTHAMNYYCLENGNINLGNYEAQQHYFPVSFREDFQRPTISQVHYTPQEIDFGACAEYVKYIVAFGENADVLRQVEIHYGLLRHEERLRVYRSKHQDFSAGDYPRRDTKKHIRNRTVPSAPQRR